MEKIKITKEQEEALEYFKGDDCSFVDFLYCRDDYDYEDSYYPLKVFTPIEFSLLLNGWFEVEEPLKHGDWVLHKSTGQYFKVAEWHNGRLDTLSVVDANNLATTLEKVTEPWKIMLLNEGREKPELKHKDVILLKNGLAIYFNECNNHDSFIEILKSGKAEKFFPVERGIEVKS